MSRYAIYQHSVNSGAVPWQVAIHALVVEAIRRDEETKHLDHEKIGKALNGLLPRRARLEDLGRGGWNDLAWLLELNQGFYNAASLASVCSIPDDRSVSWLGKPIDPAAGNERLEPIVTAFPVSGSFRKTYIFCIPPKTLTQRPSSIGLRQKPLKRDRYGLYNNEEMKGLKILAYCVVCLLVLVSLYRLFSTFFQRLDGLILLWITSILFCVLELLVGTMYLERYGWAFLDDSRWVDNLEASLGGQDNHLRTLIHWGDHQLIPNWEPPPRRPCFRGKLVDLRNRVYVEAIVVSRPNAIIPLSIHGNGITCMLLDRSFDSDKAPTFFATKVGMCNLPSYALAQTVRTATVCITSDAGMNTAEVISAHSFQLLIDHILGSRCK
ncbi:hypothetical protein B0H14DRAFT_2332532 [Mycena olivaceomarginata]|nr:hypothetical protein B0H14DRAFT_2332532 [Mycena olivaceomarginata]